MSNTPDQQDGCRPLSTLLARLRRRTAASSSLASSLKQSHEAPAQTFEHGQTEESAFMTQVQEIVHALYPSGEIGGLGNYMLLSAPAYDEEIKPSRIHEWLQGEGREARAWAAVNSGHLAMFFADMLERATQNPNILSRDEQLVIISKTPQPYTYQLSEPERYIMLLKGNAVGRVEQIRVGGR